MFRKEYPRPQFVREEWLNLNGTWEFDFDDQDKGEKEKWFTADKALSKTINVPFAFQSKLSGIHDTTFRDVVWYKREIEVPEEWKGKNSILHFGAVDFYAKVYVNGQFVGEHIGGHTPFSFDITHVLTGGREIISLRVEDPSRDETIPRGKQYWHQESASIWYTRTTGIWQTVWLEPVDRANIKKVKMTPDVDRGQVTFDFDLSKEALNKKIKIDISFKGKPIVEDVVAVTEDALKRTYYLYNNEIDRSPFHGRGWVWSPENPNLFDVSFELFDRDVSYDKVTSYFGLRKVHAEGGMVYLNNKPYYQKLVLDQGYWPEGLLTAPADEDFKKDILMTKELGFNGCRKHQKTEDPRFMYWADRLGFIVWGESASSIVYSNKTVEYMTKEWMEIVDRDYNHPSIIAWTPLNESWGVPEIGFCRVQQHFSQALYHLIHSLDNTRLVVTNDGWEQTETDICAIHAYNHGRKDQPEKYQAFAESISTKEKILASQPCNRRIYCNDFEHQGEPILLTEFGGIGFSIKDKGWGYTSADTEEEFVAEYKRVMDAVYQSKVIMGYCYTQICDVEQEINGLITYDRKFKCNPEEIREINEGWHRVIV